MCNMETDLWVKKLEYNLSLMQTGNSHLSCGFVWVVLMKCDPEP